MFRILQNYFFFLVPLTVALFFGGVVYAMDQLENSLQAQSRIENMEKSTVKIVIGQGHGSGVLLEAPNGEVYIITAGHVADISSGKTNTPPQDILVYTSEGVAHSAYVVWISSTDDVALLKLNNSYNLKGATIMCDRAPVGTKVEIIGAPAPSGFTLDWMHTYATIGGYYYHVGTEDSIMLFDGSVYGGSSGGPMFNEEGYVVGIVVAMFGDFGGWGSLIPMGFNVGVSSDIICDHMGW